MKSDKLSNKLIAMMFMCLVFVFIFSLTGEAGFEITKYSLIGAFIFAVSSALIWIWFED